MLYNMCHVLTYIASVMFCYIKGVILCYITCVMLCYITQEKITDSHFWIILGI